MRNLNPDNFLLPSLPSFNNADENVKMQSLKHVLYFSIYLRGKYDMIKSPRDHVLGGRVPGLNTLSLACQQITREENCEEKILGKSELNPVSCDLKENY